MRSDTLVRIVAVVLWSNLVLVAVSAPPNPPELDTWLLEMLLGYFAGFEAWVVALFYALGAWPFLYAGLLGDDLRARPVPAWPFVLLSMVSGAFGLLPWFALSGDKAAPGRPSRSSTADRVFGGALALVFATLLVAGALFGDVVGFVAEARTVGLVQVMAADCVVLWLTSILVVKRRSRSRAWLLALLPGVGAGLWMASGRR